MDGIGEDKQRGYLTDNEGTPSSMRLRSWGAFFAALFTEVLAYLKPPSDYYFTIWVFTVWVVAAFVPQAVNKFAEMMPNIWKK